MYRRSSKSSKKALFSSVDSLLQGKEDFLDSLTLSRLLQFLEKLRFPLSPFFWRQTLMVLFLVCFSCKKQMREDNVDVNEDSSKDEISILNNHFEELPFLRESSQLKSDFLEVLLRIESGVFLTVYLYQCVYNDFEEGYYFQPGGSIQFLYNYRGDRLCEIGGVAGVSCPEYEIDYENIELIWMSNNGFFNNICIINDPLKDLIWLKQIVNDFTDYSKKVEKCHYKIYQCTFFERNEEKTGFIVTPPCADCKEDALLLFSCSGLKLCNTEMQINIADYNINNKKLIWEIKK